MFFLHEQSNSQCTEQQEEGKESLAGYREHKTGSGTKGHTANHRRAQNSQ